MTKQLTPFGEKWQERIAEARNHLEAVRARLVETEAELAEWLARINAFEFNLRAKVGRWVKRLEDLDREIGEMRRALRLRDDE